MRCRRERVCKMRTTNEETEYWHLWARLPPIGMILILLFASVSFAGGLESTTTQIKDGKMYEKIEATGSAIIDTKLDSTSYRLFTDSSMDEPLLEFTVKNKLKGNQLTDCGLFTCEFKVSITPVGRNLKLDSSFISGGYQFGDASVEKVFFYQTEAYSYEQPNMIEEKTKHSNGTVTTKWVQKGVNKMNSTRIIEQDDLSQIYVDDGKLVEVIIRFNRQTMKAVDIYPVFFGVKEYTDWAWWNVSYNYRTIYNLSNQNDDPFIGFEIPINMSLNSSLTSGFDIRVAYVNGTVRTEIPFCRQNKTWSYVSATGIVYVNVPYIPSGNNSASIEVYFNSTTPTDGSDCAATFPIMFEETPSSANFTVGTATKTDTSYGVSITGNYQRAFYLQSEHMRYIAGVNFTGTLGDNGGGTYMGWGFGDGSYGPWALFCNNSGNLSIFGPAYTMATNSITMPAKNTWIISELNINSTKITGRIPTTSLTEMINKTDQIPTLSYSFDAYTYIGGLNPQLVIDFDWLAIAEPFNGDPPTATVGATEQNAAGIIATLISPADGTAYPLNTTSIPLSFNCSGDAAVYDANITINGVVNATNVLATSNDTSTYILNPSITEFGDYNWSVLCYNTTTSTNSSVRGFSIRNFAPNITQLTISPNGSVYQLGDLWFNITITHPDQHPMNVSYSWLKNGVNQTALAGSQLILNNTPTLIYNTASPFTIGDNWSVSVFATDGQNDSAANLTTNTTINTYFGGVVFYAPTAYHHIFTQAYLNFTLANATSASAYFVFGTSNTTMTNSGVAPNYVFTTNTALPPAATANGTWFYKATLANGSTYETTYSTSIDVNQSGFFVCNGTNTQSIFYLFQDAVFLTPINGAFQGTYVWIGDDGVSTSTTLTNSSTNATICITPPTFNRVATATEVLSAAGYLSSVATTPAMNYSAFSLNKIIFLINSSSGAFYTFQVINQYNSPVNGAIVKITLGTTTTTLTTDITGSVYVALIQLSTYQVNVSATSYQNLSFQFVAGTSTTIQVKLSNINPNPPPSNFTDVFQDVQYMLMPDSTSVDNTTPIVYSTSSPTGNLLAWGMYIYKNFQGTSTLVYNTTSAVATGGSLSYQPTSEGLYNTFIWFSASGYANFTPFPTTFSYGNSTSPTQLATQALQGGGIISGWAYYFVALVMAMLVAVALSRYTIDGAAMGGLAVLVVATMLNPNAAIMTYGTFVITPILLTTMAGVITASMLYLKQTGV